MTAASLPGAAIMTLAAGALFGVVTGTILVSFASTMGATLAFLSSRYVLIIQPNYNSASGQTLAWLANLLRGHVNVYEYNYRLEDFIQVFEDNGFSLRQSEPVFCDVFRILVFERGQA